MKRSLLFLFLLSAAHNVQADTTSKAQIDSLLSVLDGALNTYPVLDTKKEAYIMHLKSNLAKTTDHKSRFDQYGGLFDIYKNYQMDSAVSISIRRKQEALLLNNQKDIASANLNYAEVMMITGMYKNALDTIQRQRQNVVDRDLKTYIFHLYHSSYLLMKEFALTDSERKGFSKMILQYKDSILSILPKDNFGYYLVKSSQLVEFGKYKEALYWAEQAYRRFSFKHSKALSASALADAYEYLGDNEMEKKYLIISAIDDIENGVKEYISLRKLAVLLYEEGDIDRAYRYTKRCMEDAIFCNARFRTYEISHMLPIINSAYDLKNKHEKRNLRIGIILISILSLTILGFFIFTYNRLLALAKARRALKEINKELQSINNDLTATNNKLSESNHVKEEYIGYVFTMCSEYIDKMEDLRKKVNRKVKAGQIDELQKLTSSTTFVADELKEFYRSFDSVFLNLYPDFVLEFNSLLLPDEQIMPKVNDLLTPELRIFALVRLGINDSIKIAEFLHYSPQTVYNYRLKVRAKAKAAKEDFTHQVAKIGQIRK
ncbi:MAG: hypothetical protein BGN96_06310 [Bacteroidales bacterium 45-6]|nr:MAG: hypothetical protein BGN96_06310 [Bacteroidales bacterium 45-6]